MKEQRAGDVTRLLLQWRAGDEAALDTLFPLTMHTALERLEALDPRQGKRQRELTAGEQP
jgi:hypothetical protein